LPEKIEVCVLDKINTFQMSQRHEKGVGISKWQRPAWRISNRVSYMHSFFLLPFWLGAACLISSGVRLKERKDITKIYKWVCMKQTPDLEKDRSISMFNFYSRGCSTFQFSWSSCSHSTETVTYNNLQPFFASGASPQLNCTADV
jgi:hypothetical protein